MSEPAPVQVSNVSLAYRLARNRAGTFKEFAIQLVKRQVTYEKLWAVDDVSFEVHRGETFALIGPNGAGKTTLMKVVARVLPPSRGRVIVRGDLAPMISLGAGFNPELTGYENVVLFGTLLGREPDVMRERAPAIADWAGLNEFMDVPIRSYSSGMLARLGFAIASDIDPDVLVVDEVLAVGDQAFQKKSYDRMQALMSGGTAVLLVSHALEKVVQMADRVMWLEKGRVKMLGDPEEVVETYKAAAEKRCNVILLAGYYWTHNVGDLALRSVARRLLSERVGGELWDGHLGRFVLDPDEGKWDGVEAVVLPGGGLMQDLGGWDPDTWKEATSPILFWADLILEATARRIPVVAWANGFGPIRNPEAKAFARQAYEYVAYGSFRDRISREAAGLDWPVSADLALAYESLPTRPADGGPVAVVLRSFPGIEEHEAIVRAVGEFLSSRGLEPLLIPFEPFDDGVLAPLEALPGAEAVAGDAPWQHKVRRLGDCSAVITNRFHAALWGLAAGMPTVPFPTDDPKLASAGDLFSSAVRLDRDMLRDPAAISDAWDQAQAEQDRGDERRALAAELVRRVEVEADRVAEALQSPTSAPELPPLVRVALRALNAARRQALEDRERIAASEARVEVGRLSARLALAESQLADAARVRRELQEIYDSRAWKLVTRAWTAKDRVAGRVRRSGRPAESVPPVVADLRNLGGRRPALLSVIIPVYNKGRDLLGAIASVHGQTLQGVEIVVWDDGSDDPETLAALDEAAELDGVSVFHGPNRGVVAARNAAIGAAQGKFICCLDPDDRLHPTYLEKAAVLLLANPDVGIAYPWVDVVGDEAGRWETSDLDPFLILEANHLPVCSVFRWEVFAETGGFSSDMAGGYEDWELWAHAAELGFRGKAIPEPLFTYVHSHSAAASRDAQARAQHRDLVERIAGLHPRLAAGYAAPHPPAESPPVDVEALPRMIPKGAGRPVLVVLPWFTHGGADGQVEQLVRHWVEQGRTVVVVTTEPLAAGMIDRTPHLLEITPFVYRLPSLGSEDGWLGQLIGLIAALDDPVILKVGSGWLYRVLPRLRERFPKLRIVDQLFNEVGHLEANRAARHHLDLTLAAYQGLADRLRSDGRPPESVEVLLTGIEPPAVSSPDEVAALRRHLGIASGRRVVAFIGRLSEEKRPAWAVSLGTDLPGTTVVVAGDGPERHDVERAAAEGTIVWEPLVDPIATLYGLADVVVIPSRTEGIPNVAMEALALGVPIVATRVGGLPELEDAGVRLVDPDDYPGFVEAVQAALASPAPAAGLPGRFEIGEMLAAYDRVVGS